jgi:Domain of unknown function (DUF6950)
MTAPIPLHGRISDRSLDKRLALPGYLDELASTPWCWGSVDCTMAVATWIFRITGTDPLERFRGRYHSASDAKRTARLAGGFLPALGELFDAAGLERTQTFEEGDVAAVNAGMHERFVLPVVGAILAIRFGELWVVKAHRGIVARDFQVIHGWRL